jgi:hypothetical protein
MSNKSASVLVRYTTYGRASVSQRSTGLFTHLDSAATGVVPSSPVAFDLTQPYLSS